MKGKKLNENNLLLSLLAPHPNSKKGDKYTHAHAHTHQKVNTETAIKIKTYVITK